MYFKEFYTHDLFFRNCVSNMVAILLYTLYPDMQIPPVPNPAP